MDIHALILHLLPQNAVEMYHLHHHQMFVVMEDFNWATTNSVMMEIMTITMDALEAVNKKVAIFAIIMLEVLQFVIRHMFVDSLTMLFHWSNWAPQPYIP